MTSALRPLVALGDRSYSLYLVHWPLLAFANNAWLHAVPYWTNAAALVVGLGWMELQYRLVERRFRTMTINVRTIAVLIAVPVLALTASAG